ncbi:MAG: Ig-like domain-containing protein [Campylobacterota bacterium]|nr:Ig-like domain-containing protein [Campylobacterota bacterium]
MSIKFLIVSLFSIILFFGGCSSGETAVSNEQLQKTNTGYLVDSSISGVEYYSIDTGVKGTTNTDGQFEYVENTILVFKIGGVKLAQLNSSTINDDNILYPTDLIGTDRNDTNNTKVVNILQLLQSLDDDKNPYNGITISTQTSQDLSNSTLDLTLDTTTSEDINATLDELNITIVPQDEAIAHFEYTLQSNGLNIDTVAPPKATLITDLPEQIITDSFDINISAESDTIIFVNDINTTNKVGLDGVATITLDTNGTNGSKTFQINLLDNNGNFSEDLNITLYKNTNRVPVGTFSSFTLDEDSSYDGILTASDENNDTVSFTLDSNSSNGTITLENNGTFSYTPNTNFNGSDSFRYKVNDYNLTSEAYSVTIDINPVFDEINSTIYTTTIEEDSTYDFNLTEISNSFSNPDNLEISKITIISLPSNGTLQLDSNDLNINDEINSSSFANIQYIPNSNEDTNDSFTISANDLNISSKIDLNISSINDTPYITNNQNQYADENQLEAFAISILDPDDESFTYHISTGSDFHKFDLNETNGVVSFKTAPDYETQNSYNFKLTVTDSKDASTDKNITVNINDIADVDPTFTLENYIFTSNEISIDDYLIAQLTFDKGDSNITSITLSGDGADSFDVSNDGNLTLKSTASLDYETQKTYNLTATISNESGSNDTTVTINVENNYFIHRDNNPTLQNPTNLKYFGSDIALNDSDKVISSTQDSVRVFDKDSNTIDSNITIAHNNIDIKSKIAIADQNNNIIYIYNTDGTYESNITDSDKFGSDISIDDTNILIGAKGKVSNKGKAYIYQISDLSLQNEITNPNDTINDYFGSSVAINGDYIAVAASGYDNNKGAVYIYKIDDLTNPIKTYKGTNSSDNFGSSLAIYSSFLLIGSSGVDNNTGEVNIYQLNGNIVEFMETHQAYDKSENSYFGSSISINQDRDILIGAPGDTDISGKVYVYEEDYN